MCPKGMLVMGGTFHSTYKYLTSQQLWRVTAVKMNKDEALDMIKTKHVLEVPRTDGSDLVYLDAIMRLELGSGESAHVAEKKQALQSKITTAFGSSCYDRIQADSGAASRFTRNTCTELTGWMIRIRVETLMDGTVQLGPTAITHQSAKSLQGGSHKPQFKLSHSIDYIAGYKVGTTGLHDDATLIHPLVAVTIDHHRWRFPAYSLLGLRLPRSASSERSFSKEHPHTEQKVHGQHIFGMKLMVGGKNKETPRETRVAGTRLGSLEVTGRTVARMFVIWYSTLEPICQAYISIAGDGESHSTLDLDVKSPIAWQFHRMFLRRSCNSGLASSTGGRPTATSTQSLVPSDLHKCQEPAAGTDASDAPAQ
ncbi:hypothetical protein BU15DRAFT_64964 [Melanogaster broomeanus]|nr:hypothetical protein BU15DRAFT_64964 [Melanogaster broomeanus]